MSSNFSHVGVYVAVRLDDCFHMCFVVVFSIRLDDSMDSRKDLALDVRFACGEHMRESFVLYLLIQCYLA